ncbi:MAG: hypothetical protein HYY96_03095 [Candidatus Tectomicrobia bacterium]|nr:hypothetical protein [Candidatus Tectomicrobia bacterium]
MTIQAPTFFEMSIVILARMHNPSILNPDFLRLHGIVPQEWELVEAPLCTEPFAKVAYKCGVTVLAQFDRLIFSEQTDGDRLEHCRIPDIAAKYVETLPHVDYRAVGINPKARIMLEGEPEVRAFLLGKFLARGPWDELDHGKPLVSLSFAYARKGGAMNITIQGETPSGAPPRQSLLVASNFHHEVEPGQDRAMQIKQICRAWAEDVTCFSQWIAAVFSA